MMTTDDFKILFAVPGSPPLALKVFFVFCGSNFQPNLYHAMKILSLVCLCVFQFSTISSLKAQKGNDDAIYVFKEDWSSAKNFDEATYFMQVTKDNDTTFVCRYYNKFGPMVKQESYFDAD